MASNLIKNLYIINVAKKESLLHSVSYRSIGVYFCRNKSNWISASRLHIFGYFVDDC